MKEQLNALHQRASLYSITNISSSLETVTQAQEEERPGPRRLRGCQGRSGQTAAAPQNFSRAKSAIIL